MSEMDLSKPFPVMPIKENQEVEAHGVHVSYTVHPLTGDSQVAAWLDDKSREPISRELEMPVPGQTGKHQRKVLCLLDPETQQGVSLALTPIGIYGWFSITMADFDELDHGVPQDWTDEGA